MIQSPIRINTLGASGAGASTLARAIADALAIPSFDADDYYHAPSDPPFQSPRPTGERNAMLRADLDRSPSWVLAGGVSEWGLGPPLDFTLIVFLRVPTEVRLQRLRERERARFGDRIAPGGDMHATHLAFLEWAAGYDGGAIDGKTLTRHRAWLASQTCSVIELAGDRPVSELLAHVLRATATKSHK